MPRIDGRARTGKEVPRPNRPWVQKEWAPSILVAVDPGDVHVGVSRWCATEPPNDTESGWGWACTWSREMAPGAFVEWLSRELLLGTVDILVYESWALQADRAMAQVGSEMETAQLIGVIRYLAEGLAAAKARWPAPELVLVKQHPQNKKPTDSIRRARGVGFQAPRDGVTGDHATDSELHALYHIWNTRNDRVLTPTGGSVDVPF